MIRGHAAFAGSATPGSARVKQCIAGVDGPAFTLFEKHCVDFILKTCMNTIKIMHPFL